MGKIKDTNEYLGANELKEYPKLMKALVAELVGTLFLVLVGCGSCTNWTGVDFDGKPPSDKVVQIALAFGVTVATMAQAIGHVSGCHINPAITCGMLVARHISIIRALLYIAMQIIGGIIGAAILKGLTPEKDLVRSNLGMTSLNKDINAGQGFGVELMITFVLVLVVFGVCDDRRDDIKGSAPLAIGLSITTCHLFAVPITGASMNPARTFGPAVITGIWENHWVYWAGPIVGGILAAMIYSFIFRHVKAEDYDVEDAFQKRAGNA